MQKSIIAFISAAVSASMLMSCVNGGGYGDSHIAEADFTKIQLEDRFWNDRIETNRTVTIPAALHECEVNGRISNFAKAAGLFDGPHMGDFSFDDTDVYKVLEGISFSLAVHYDAALDAQADSIIAIIAQAQEPDGYLTTCVTNECDRLRGWWGKGRWDKINSHELYNSGHLIEAAVAHYQATGKQNFLNVAIKNADLICEVFGPEEGQIHRPSGHPIVEMALAKLYNVTGEQRYLDLAKYFVEETGRCTDGHAPSAYSQDHMPILEQEEIVGHAVRAGYLYSGVADVASLTGDSEYFTALERIWNNMASKKMYITGGIGSRPQGEGFGPEYELHNMENYCETCASIANVYWNHRMFLATGDAKYIDVLERALYNGVMAGVSLDGYHFFYDNPLSSMGQHERERWFGCACCPGNITRFVASVPKYMYATAGSDIFVNLYIASTSVIDLENGSVCLKQETAYPWEGTVRVSVNPSVDGKFALKFRIPGWAQGRPVPTDLYSYANDIERRFEVKLNGKSVKTRLVDGYVTIDRNWKGGDVVELSLPMDVNVTVANEKVPADRGLVELERGPIVYCIEGADIADGQVFDKYIDPAQTFTTEWCADLLKGVTVLHGKAVKVASDGSESDVDITAIPYSTWQNRGRQNMEVWIATAAEYATPTPEPTIASRAKAIEISSDMEGDDDSVIDFRAKAEGTPIWGVNDLWEPTSSSDIGKPYYYFWQKRGSVERVAYIFEQMETISSTDIYWLDFEHYDGDFRVPAEYSLYYKRLGSWVPVKTDSDYKVRKDCWNHVDFEPVLTDGLMLRVKLQDGVSGGICEWKVN